MINRTMGAAISGSWSARTGKEPLGPRNQDSAHVPAVDCQHAAGPAVVALSGALSAWTARTDNFGDVRPAGGCKLLKAFFRPVAKDRLAITLRLPAFRRIKAIQANAGAIVQPDRVAVRYGEALRYELIGNPEHVGHWHSRNRLKGKDGCKK